MSTTDTQCAIQRFVTNSEYDHIGMIVNFNGEVKIFEANADEGVNVYNWAQFQTEFHKYEKISVRKLHYHRSNEVQPLLMKFIKSTIGKKYDLGALKLMRRKASSDEEVQNGFFCSELIAKVYKTLGLLSLEKASSNYWPVDFTMRGGINLLDSASLGQ
jgi:palmitoyltransferase